MRVIIPAKYRDVVAHLRDGSGILYRLKEYDDHYELEVLTSLSFDRIALGLTERKLGRFYRDVEVVGGSKKKGRDHIVFEPKRPFKVTIRFAEGELSLIKDAARKKGATLAEFIRFHAVDGAFELARGERHGIG